MTTKITFTFKLHLSDLKFRRIFLNLLPISAHGGEANPRDHYSVDQRVCPGVPVLVLKMKPYLLSEVLARNYMYQVTSNLIISCLYCYSCHLVIEIYMPK